MKIPSVFLKIMFRHPKKKIDLLRDKVRMSWNNLEINLHLWTPEIIKPPNLTEILSYQI